MPTFDDLAQKIVGGKQLRDLYLDEWVVLIGTIIVSVVIITTIISDIFGKKFVSIGEKCYQWYTRNTLAGQKLASLERLMECDGFPMNQQAEMKQANTPTAHTGKTGDRLDDLVSDVELIEGLRRKEIEKERRENIPPEKSILQQSGESDSNYLERVKGLLLDSINKRGGIDAALSMLRSEAANQRNPERVHPSIPQVQMSEEEEQKTVFGSNRKIAEAKTRLSKLARRCASGDTAQAQASYQDFKQLMDQYLEQPTLLDSVYPEVIRTLFQPLLSQLPSLGSTSLCPIFDSLYCLCRTRGAKTLVKFFPNGSDLTEPVFAALLSVFGSPVSWTAPYILFLWANLLCLVPFDLVTIDSGYLAERALSVLRSKMPFLCKELSVSSTDVFVTRLIKSIGDSDGLTRTMCAAAGYYFSTSQPARDTAPLALARILVRSDTVEYLASFIRVTDELFREAALPGAPPFKLDEASAALTTLSAIFDYGDRQSLRATVLQSPLADFESIHALAVSPSAVIRRQAMRCATRFGRLFASPVPAPWRTLATARPLFGGDSLSPQAADIDFDVPEVFDDCVDTVLLGLLDTDSVVRWAAAKGVAALTERIPLVFADELTTAVLGFCTPAEYWHGPVLALAELSHRGLIMPSRLPDVTRIICNALMYSRRDGKLSAGGTQQSSGVRDAAAYAVWALARSLPPQILRPHATTMAATLLAAACFDPVVSIRRAASAAFQELVGRLGGYSIPAGIAATQLADFVSVGRQRVAFLQVAPAIARLNTAYHHEFVRYLFDQSIGSQQEGVRQLAARALALLTVIEPDDVDVTTVDVAMPSSIAGPLTQYASEQIIPLLVPLSVAKSDESSARAGTVEALAEIYRMQHDCLPPELAQHAFTLVREVSRRRLLGLRSGELCLPFARFVAAAAHVLATDPTVLSQALELLWFCVQTCAEDALLSAAVAIGEVVRCSPDPEAAAAGIVDSAAETLRMTGLTPAEIAKAAADELACTQGCALVLSQMPPEAASPALDLLAEVAVDRRMGAVTRSHCITAITDILSRFGAQPALFSDGTLSRRLAQLVATSSNDYTTTRHGDVGSHVRDACVWLVPEILRLTPGDHLSTVLTVALPALFSLATGPVDRVRCSSCIVLLRLYSQNKHSTPLLPELPELASVHSMGLPLFELEAPAQTRPSVTLGEMSGDLDQKTMQRITSDVELISRLMSPAYVFPLIAPVLMLPGDSLSSSIAKEVAVGLSICAGNLTPAMMHPGISALRGFLDAAPPQAAALYWQTVILRLASNISSDRECLPLLRTITTLVEDDRIDWDQSITIAKRVNTLGSELVRLAGFLTTRCTKNVTRLALIIRLYGALGEAAAFANSGVDQSRQSSPEITSSVVLAVLTALIQLICHSFPRVRSLAAIELQELVVTSGPLLTHVTGAHASTAQIQSILANTRWASAPASLLNEARFALCDILSVTRPEAAAPESLQGCDADIDETTRVLGTD